MAKSHEIWCLKYGHVFSSWCLKSLPKCPGSECRLPLEVRHDIDVLQGQNAPPAVRLAFGEHNSAGRWVAFSWSPWGRLGRWYNTDTKSDYVASEDGFMMLRWGLSINEQVIPLLLTSNWVRSHLSAGEAAWSSYDLTIASAPIWIMIAICFFKSPILKTHTYT